MNFFNVADIYKFKRYRHMQRKLPLICWHTVHHTDDTTFLQNTVPDIFTTTPFFHFYSFPLSFL